MDNLGFVFIMGGGGVPPFATGASHSWARSSQAGRRTRSFRQIEHAFALTFVWVPRGLSVSTDYLSHAAEGQQHHYTVRTDRFACLDCLWGTAQLRTSGA